MTQPFPPPAQEPAGLSAGRRPWPRRRWIIVGAAAAIAAATTGAGAVVAISAKRDSFGPPGVASFLCYSQRGSTSAALLQWKMGAKGNISGTYQAADISGSAPSEHVSTNNGPLSGQVNGSGISVRLGWTNEIFGKVTSSSLVLQVPQPSGAIEPLACTPGGISGWNHALRSLNSSVSHANTAAQIQQQDSQDLQAAQNDLITLQQDDSFGGDLSSLFSDVQAAASDLGSLKSDAAAGKGSYCDNVYSVGDDAYSVDDDLYSMSDDLDTLTSDISAVRQDMSALQGALQTLSGDGVAPPAGAAGAITAARTAIHKAIAGANSDIDQADTIDRTAYAIADGLATGGCTGQGPGKPSALIKHI